MNPKIRAIYRRLKYLLQQIPLPDKQYRINSSIVDSYHQAITELNILSDEPFDQFRVSPSTSDSGWGNDGNKVLWETTPVRTQVGSLIGYLEGMYSLGEQIGSATGTQPAITLINQNTIAITLNFSLQQLIDKSQSREEKEKLILLEQELSEPNKNWDSIKSILIWAANFSKELFFQLLPIMLKHYGISS